MHDFTKINNGDVLGVVSNADYSHVSVAYWTGGILYSVEMDGSDNVLRPITQHLNSGKTIAVFTPLVSNDAMMNQFAKATSSTINYDWLDFISIFSRIVLKLNILPEPADDMVCSSFVSRWMSWAGWVQPLWFPKIPCPAEVCKVLGKPKVILTPEKP